MTTAARPLTFFCCPICLTDTDDLECPCCGKRLAPRPAFRPVLLNKGKREES